MFGDGKKDDGFIKQARQIIFGKKQTQGIPQQGQQQPQQQALGYAQIGTGTGTGSGSNRGVYAWNRENGNDELYQVYGSDMYKYNGTNFESIGSGFGSGTSRFAQLERMTCRITSKST